MTHRRAYHIVHIHNKYANNEVLDEIFGINKLQDDKNMVESRKLLFFLFYTIVFSIKIFKNNLLDKLNTFRMINTKNRSGI